MTSKGPTRHHRSLCYLVIAVSDLKLPERAEPGVVIGGYELVRQIGRGGMADVWVARKALSHKGSRIVALKLIADHFVGDERYARMFRAEAELAAGLSHANIVQVFDEGEEDGRSYLVMEWVDGPNLLKLGDMLAFLGDEQRRFRVISYVIGQLLYALDYAHSITTHDGSPMGVVHRDVSPQNVLVSNHGEVKLTDFGVACHNSERSSGLHIKGKVRYMAPEQLSGKTRAPTIDLYAVGAILHELIDGKKFRGDHEDGQDLFSVVLSGQIPPMSRSIPPELDQLRLGLLERNPARRIQTAEQALALLKRYPGYGDARDELTKLCRHLTGIAKPRTAPGQSSKVPAADQATTRWGGRQAASKPRVAAPPAIPPAPPRAKLVRGPALRTESTTAVKDANATSKALITGNTVVMEAPPLPLLHGNAAVVAPPAPLAPTAPLRAQHLRMAPAPVVPAPAVSQTEAQGWGASQGLGQAPSTLDVHGRSEPGAAFGPPLPVAPPGGSYSAEWSGTAAPTGTQNIDPSMIIAMEPSGRIESDASFHPAVGDGSDVRRTYPPVAQPDRGDSVSIVLTRGVAVVLVIFALAMIAAVSVLVTWVLVTRGRVAAGEDHASTPAAAWVPPVGAVAVPGADVAPPPQGATPQDVEEPAAAKPPVVREASPEAAPEPTEERPALVDADDGVEVEADPRIETGTEPPAEPPAKPAGTAWVKLASSTDLKGAQVRIGSKVFGMDETAERRVSAGGKALKWRKSSADPWRAASSATFKPGRHYVIYVGKKGPMVRTAERGR
jgi:serine/threonine protein kinase